MHSEPFFSVILPTYNREKMLPNAIRSVIAQQFPDWELIIVDDGSTDGTKRIVADFQDERIKYFFQKNAERSAARNNGIRHAKGKYIAFLDDDDEYLPVHLQYLYKFITERNQPVAMIFTDYMYNGLYGESKTDEFLLAKNTVEFLLITPIGAPRVCLHSRILSEYRFDEKMNFGEDFFLWISISLKYPLLHLNAYTINCSINASSSISLTNSVFPPIIRNLRRLFHDYKGTGVISRKVEKSVLSNYYYRKSKFYYLKGSFLPMFWYLTYSFLLQPTNKQNKEKLYQVKSYLLGPRISKLNW